MATANNATPLLALDAIVIDTETTGLDPARARIVEIAAMRLIGGRIDSSKTFRRLVHPGEPIPPSATEIHHIDDAAVARAPRFPEVWAELSGYSAGAVMIGHTLGFDLAMFKRECERAGLPFNRPRTLDTRLLAEVAEPNLAEYTLESLAAWLGIEIKDRHSALGDALTAARIYTALVPKLREGGIRTLGEAMQACRALIDVLDEQHRAGWVEAVETPSRSDAERTLQRIDTYPYRHRIRDIMRKPPQFISTTATLDGALKQMIAERISSLFVHSLAAGQTAVRAADAGIITERDALRALAAHGADALSWPAGQFMSRPLAAIPADAFIYLAIGRMSRLRIRHLAAVDEAGCIVGALSARDLLRLRASEAISLGDEIDEARDVHDLGAAWAKLPQVAASLTAEDVGTRDIAAVISRELGALTRQAAVIAGQRMREAGLGDPPCPYAVAVLGSAGRGESLLAMDQDNALIFAEGKPGGPHDLWFEKLGNHIADILHEAGVPYCKGGVMGKNPQWRGSRATWRERVGDWLRRSNPRDLLAVDIFFDMRPVHGDGGLCNEVWRGAFDAAHHELGFAKLLAEAAGAVESGLGFFGGFKTSGGRIDLKKSGLFGIVTMARVLAIRHHVVERSTPARLAGIKALGLGAERDLDALADAQGVFLDFILRQQIDDIEHGKPPANGVEVKQLSRHDRERLRAALESVRNLDTLTHDLLFKG